METGEGRPGVAATLRALNGALGRPAAPWVKESGARNLRHRDFLAPRAALSAAFPGGQVGGGGAGKAAAGGGASAEPRAGGGLTPRLLARQVPADVVAGVTSLGGPGVLAVRGCQQTPAGLAVQVRRPEAFRRLLGPRPGPAAAAGAPAGWVVLHCPALRGPAALRPRHLRPLLLADHLAQLLRAQG